MAQTPKDEHDNQQNQPQEPWNTKFDDDLDDDGNYSRVKKRRRSHGNSVLTWSITVGLIVILLVPIIWLAVDKRMQNSADTQESSSVAVSSSAKAKRSSSAKAASEAKASSKAASKSSSAKKASVAKASSKSAAKGSSTSASASESSTAESSSSSAESSSASSAAGTYTVQSGDNLYRIAVNHGMSLSEIQELNGMGSSTSVTPGQTLKVK
ncbi:LysM peptidoglycan-binding domain-containing protein [Lacticaseibacillus pantheris]|uniref:LysM peptidoglycan-binding domain-containing protein n=1 Tax=Lacticaseibacillus pantheris TaxID=171523 RepID=UPI0007048CBE|nr:LysM peptidoglycan-binding domain-containing protein [Lacticaseibacillus pantheris]WKF85472.1 LysM peptidoglycan-binding domain-containing protein [Lacticaseibacillus pantheris]